MLSSVRKSKGKGVLSAVRRQSAKLSLNNRASQKSTRVVSPESASSKFQTWFENQGIIATDAQLEKASLSSIESLQTISDSIEDFTSVTENPVVKAVSVEPVTSKRGVKLVKGAVKLVSKSAADMFRALQTEEGMSLLDPKGLLLRMEYPVIGPVGLGNTNGRCHVEHLQKVGKQGNKDLVHLVIVNEDELEVLYNSCLIVGAPGGSIYQDEQVTTMSAPRSVHSSRFKVVPCSENSCEVHITFFFDLCGFTKAAENNKRNLKMVTNALMQLSKFGGSKPRVTEDMMSIF